ncbi:hypothetical protein Tco_1035750 [Tanacetum coccineum]
MMVQDQEEMGEGLANPTDPHHTPIITQPSTSKPQNKQKPRKPKRKDTEIPQSSGPTEPIAYEAANKENVPTQSNDLLLSRGCIKQGSKYDNFNKDAEKLLRGQDVVEKEVSTADPVTTAGEVVTTASVEVSAATTTTTTVITESTTTTSPSTIPKAKSISFRDPSKSTTRTTLIQIPSNIKDKGKAKMIEPEKPWKKTEQIRLDEELAFKLQAKEAKQARLAREKSEKVEEANISWDNVQAMIEAARLLVEILQVREQEELIDEEKARLFIELLEKRKKHFTALRAQEKKNKPPTKEQKKSTMSTYLKHMAGYKQSQLKNNWLKESSKKSKARWHNKVSSREQLEELNKRFHRKGRKGYYEIIRADGSAKTYLLFSQLLKEFDREDLENLWKLFTA